MTTLHLHQVSRHYGRLQALHPLTLTIPTGTRHAIVGPNGAGKTTLLALIAGTIRPSSGRILLDDHDITTATVTARARHGIARTWQHPAVLPHLTCADNLLVALTAPTADPARHRLLRRHTPATIQAQRLLAAAGLDGYAATPAGRLPYGTQRRLELAMALATRPRLLLLDEPSAGLAPAERTHLAATITALPATVTVICIDHDPDLVATIADTVTTLDAGRHVTTTPTAPRHTDPPTPSVRRGRVIADPGIATDAGHPGPPPAAAPPDPPDPPADDAVPLLRVRHLDAGYGGAPVVADLTLDVAAGDVLAVLGRNGAGKTTLLAALARLLPPGPGSRIELAGHPLPDTPHQAARAGIATVAQGHRLFATLTVAEHLRLAAHTSRHRHTDPHPPTMTLDDILYRFPALAGRRGHHPAALSGGEQQILAIAQALLTNPRLLLLDEPGEGLAPTATTQLITAIRDLADTGTAVIIAEQRLPLAHAVADHAIVLDQGRITATGPLHELITTSRLASPLHVPGPDRGGDGPV